MTHELKYLLSIVKFLIFGDVLKHEYVVMSLGIELPVSQCVVSQGPYQCLSSHTQYTDSPPRELIETQPLSFFLWC